MLDRWSLKYYKTKEMLVSRNIVITNFGKFDLFGNITLHINQLED